MVGWAVLLEVVERVGPEMLMHWEAVVVVWSVATLVKARLPSEVESRFVVYVAPLRSGREAEIGDMTMHTERTALEYMEETA